MKASSYQDVKERLAAAEKLLLGETVSVEKFQSVKALIKGVHPDIDKKLDLISTVISDLQKFQKGEIVELSIEHLPETTEEEKKRKKKILLFIKYWKELQSEIVRVRHEYEQKEQKSSQDHLRQTANVISAVKGPFGIITIAAVLIVGSLLLINRKTETPTNQNNSIVQPSQSPIPSTSKIQGIIVNGKKIPLREIYVGTGTDCDSPHYHAKDHTSVKSISGETVSDPGGCGFGKVKDVQVVDIE